MKLNRNICWYDDCEEPATRTLKQTIYLCGNHYDQVFDGQTHMVWVRMQLSSDKGLVDVGGGE